MIKRTWFSNVLLLILAIRISGCSRSESKSVIPAQSTTPRVTEGGKNVSLSNNPSDQIMSVPVEQKHIANELKVPCRVAVSASSSLAGGAPILLFDSNELSEIVSEYTRTKAQFERTKNRTARLRDLVMHEAAPGKDLADSETEIKQLQATLASLESKIRVAGLDVQHSLNLSPSNVIVVADIPESQLASVRPGSKVSIVVNSYPNEVFYSAVRSLGIVVDPVTRSVKVQVRIPNKNNHLLAGMYGQMSVGASEQARMTVPVSSVFTAQGKSYLFVSNGNGMYERREVLLGVQGADWIEVLQGVQAGEQVISKGAMLLKSLSFGY